jgi:hypothetical protein
VKRACGCIHSKRGAAYEYGFKGIIVEVSADHFFDRNPRPRRNALHFIPVVGAYRLMRKLRYKWRRQSEVAPIHG